MFTIGYGPRASHPMEVPNIVADEVPYAMWKRMEVRTIAEKLPYLARMAIMAVQPTASAAGAATLSFMKEIGLLDDRLDRTDIGEQVRSMLTH